MERLPKSREQRKMADYRATDSDSCVYTIEVEGKESTKQYQEMMDAARERGVAFSSIGISGKDTMAKIIRHATEQVRETPGSQNTLCILWLSCLDGDSKLVLEQFYRTLYGTMLVGLPTDEFPPEVERTVPCFYWNFNEFFKIRDIDAAVLANQHGQVLCINSFGDRVEPVRNSRLYRVFSQDRDKTVCDPGIMEQQGEALLADVPADRSDQSAIWKAVTSKYGFEYLFQYGEVAARGVLSVRDVEANPFEDFKEWCRQRPDEVVVDWGGQLTVAGQLGCFEFLRSGDVKHNRQPHLVGGVEMVLDWSDPNSLRLAQELIC